MNGNSNPSNGGRAAVETLLSLITAAAHQAMNEYEKAGHNVPDPALAHPLDSTYDLLDLKKAVAIVEGACHQLCNTLAQPAQIMSNRMTMPVEPACLRVAVQARVADILLPFPEGLHSDRIGEKATIDSEKIERVLRLLVMRGCFREVSPRVFANNRLSLTLLSTNPISSSVKIFTDDFNKGLALLYDALTDPVFAFSHEPTRSPFMYSLKADIKDGIMWEWYRSRPEQREHFDRGMVGWSNVTGAMAALQCPIWGSLPSGSSVCDVGSGVGGFTIALARKYPKLKITLCDLPEAVVQARQFWQSNYPEAIQETRVDFVPLDCFREAMEGHDIYYIRHVIHNWRDEKSLVLLRNIRQVMRASTRLLVQEYVLPHMNEIIPTNAQKMPENTVTQGFHPGSDKLYNLDIMMLVALNAKERTLNEYAKLGSKAGLKLEKHWEFAETSLLEFRLLDEHTS